MISSQTIGKRGALSVHAKVFGKPFLSLSLDVKLEVFESLKTDFRGSFKCPFTRDPM